jgi:hypothetical protein
MSNGKKNIKYFNAIELDKPTITLGKMYKYNMEISYIKPYYQGNKIIFRTPMMFLYNQPKNIYDNDGKYLTGDYYSIDLLFYNNDNDDDVTLFEKWYTDLEDTLCNILKKRQYLNLKRSNFRSNFYYDEYKKANKLKLRLDTKKSNFFILNQQNKLSSRINYDELVCPTYGLFIIELENIWVKRPVILDDSDFTENTYGFNFVVHASQCLPSHCIINPININPDDFGSDTDKLINFKLATTTSSCPPPPPPPPFPNMFLNIGNTQPEIPEYLKTYMSMLKMGVPKLAVKHKMTMVGLDPELLDNPNKSTTNIFDNISIINNDTIPKITSDMLKGVSLRKTDITLNKKKPPVSNMGFNVSLDDILSMKSKLIKQHEPKLYEKPRYKSDSDDDNMSDFSDNETSDI